MAFRDMPFNCGMRVFGDFGGTGCTNGSNWNRDVPTVGNLKARLARANPAGMYLASINGDQFRKGLGKNLEEVGFKFVEKSGNPNHIASTIYLYVKVGKPAPFDE